MIRGTDQPFLTDEQRRVVDFWIARRVKKE